MPTRPSAIALLALPVTWMGAMALWQCTQFLVNVLPGVGHDRAESQYGPMLEHAGLPVGGSHVLAWLVGGFELIVGLVFAVGTFVERRRIDALLLGTAGQVVQFGLFLSTTFVFAGVGRVPYWTQYPPLIVALLLPAAASLGLLVWHERLRR